MVDPVLVYFEFVEFNFFSIQQFVQNGFVI